MPKSITGIVAQKLQVKQSQRRSPRGEQLTLWKSPQPEHPLRIECLPDVLQWWDEERYWLVHEASGLRVPGSWSLAEAELIQDLSKHWDWSVDDCDHKVACGIQLLSLTEAVCSRSAAKGAKGGEE
jgi:hypothetical protein